MKPAVFARISSAAHPVMRLARQLATPHGRRKRGLVILEGIRAAEAAAGNRARVDAVLLSETAPARATAIGRRLATAGIRAYELPEGLLRDVSLVMEPQGIVLLCAPPLTALDDALGLEFVLVADGVADPGNLGSLVRSARAFGAGAVVTTRGTAEVFSPKALRAAAGEWPGLAISEDAEPRRLGEALKARGFRILVGDPRGTRGYTEPVWRGRVALILGSEAHGAGALWSDLGAVRIRIPSEAESLNVSAAGAVLLAEAAHQRAGGAAKGPNSGFFGPKSH